ncbi:hypothetical protein TWF594_008702 [Orbilia oligospora]|nr:hypothetical protein TWF594_008702 [Orbilia oligospora]
MALVKIPTSSMMDIDTQMKQTSLVPVKRKRASPITAMDEYKEEMKFYYLGLNYTLEKVRETMESHYHFGASLIQYRDRLNKWGFKKRGAKRQWETIAESVVTRGGGKESEAVINGDFFVSSKKVKKEIARKFSLTELACMKNKASTTQVISPTSPILATVEVRSPIASPLSWPIFTTWCIPMELLNSLPIKISDPEIITICKSALSYRRGLQPEEKVIMESRGQHELWSLGSTSMMKTEKDYSLLRSLRYDCGISISLLILRALLFEWNRDARMLLRSLISPIKSPKSKVEDTDTRDPWVVPDCFDVMPVGELMFEVISREAHDSRGINGNITPLGSARDIWMVHQNGQISIPPRSYQKHTGNSGSSFRETTRENFDWETAICSEYRKISMILKDQNKCDGTLDGSGIGILTSKTKYEFAGVLENDYNVRVSRRSLERVIRQMKDVKFGISVDLRSNEDGVIHNMMRQRRKLLQLAADWYDDTEILECLIGTGGGVNAPSVSDLGTALQICCRRPTAALPPGVKRIKTVRILVEAGATINPRYQMVQGHNLPLLTAQSSLVTLQWPDTS